MKGCSGKDLERRNVLSLERKSEWVMEYQITVRILRTAYVNKAQRVNFPMPYIRRTTEDERQVESSNVSGDCYKAPSVHLLVVGE